MARTTIDFGIDLGTTNSEIAVFTGSGTEVFKGEDMLENTASAVWVKSARETIVGSLAKDQAEHDPANAKTEFKRLMHRAEPLVFEATGVKMLPEQLSAEVLKALKANVTNEEVRAAVISIPASFQGEAVEATMRAARLAGLDPCPLLTEPACAAIAYGFNAETGAGRKRWLIYDFGGGTFDAALVHNHGGGIAVEDCEGNNFLGGKNIDYDIVNELFVPALLKRARLANFSRDNPKWVKAYAKLKFHAEKAKIRLSRSATATIDIRDLCNDDAGASVDFEFELTQEHVRRIADPYIAKSINICKSLLAKKGVGPDDIEKVILVGGPTLMPCLRERLADRAEGLGIALEFQVDPFTVVARGAAIYAASQPMPADKKPPARGEYKLVLDAKSAGADDQPPVAGQVIASGAEDLSGFSLEIANQGSRPPWRSPRIALTADGKFLTTVAAERGRPNTFSVTLLDGAGNRRPITPNTFPYLVIPTELKGQPLIHDISVGLADNTVATLFKRGTPLPVKIKDYPFRTAFNVRKGSDEDALKVPILEGEQARADRNQRYGTVEISAKDFRLDLPAGSEVSLTIEIDESRVCHAELYIPYLDLTRKIDLVKPPPENTAQQLAQKVAEEKKRLEAARAKTSETGEIRAQTQLRQIEAEGLEREVDSAMAAARTDTDSADRAADRLLSLQIALDRVESALEWPTLLADAERQIKLATDTVDELGDAADKGNLKRHVEAVRKAMGSNDTELLRHELEQLSAFAAQVIGKNPELVTILLFKWMADDVHKMRNRAEAERLVQAGLRAINANDLPALREIVMRLHELLPPEARDMGPFGGQSSVLDYNR